MTRIAIRGFIAGKRIFEEIISVDEDSPDLEATAGRHAAHLLAEPGGERHWIEMEFIDERDGDERFFTFTADPAGITAEIGRKPARWN